MYFFWCEILDKKANLTVGVSFERSSAKGMVEPSFNKWTFFFQAEDGIRDSPE